jgi:hypothetical protein
LRKEWNNILVKSRMFADLMMRRPLCFHHSKTGMSARKQGSGFGLHDQPPADNMSGRLAVHYHLVEPHTDHAEEELG